MVTVYRISSIKRHGFIINFSVRFGVTSIREWHLLFVVPCYYAPPAPPCALLRGKRGEGAYNRNLPFLP